MKNVTVFTIDKSMVAVEDSVQQFEYYRRCSAPSVGRYGDDVIMQDYVTKEVWELQEFNIAQYNPETFPSNSYDLAYDTTYVVIDPDLERIVSLKFKDKIAALKQERDGYKQSCEEAIGRFGEEVIAKGCLEKKCDTLTALTIVSTIGVVVAGVLLYIN